MPVSRENEPTAFPWIFGAFLGLLGLGAGVWGVLRGRGPERRPTIAAGEPSPPPGA